MKTARDCLLAALAILALAFGGVAWEAAGLPCIPGFEAAEQAGVVPGEACRND